jgi:hypothetical protein
VNVTPLGSVPVVKLRVGTGKPKAVTLNVPDAPTVKVVLFGLVNEGASSTVNVKLWVASVPAPLCAVNVMPYVPPVLVAGVPLSTPVELLNVTPVGSGPDSLSVGAGVPVAITVNVPGAPTVNVVLFELVIVGPPVTVRVAAFELTLPAELVNTARYWYPFCRNVTPGSVSVVDVAPLTLLNVAPLSVLTCHCTVGAGFPLAEAMKVAVPPAATV